MLQLQLHTADTAPEGSVATIEQAQKAFGFVPNLIAYLSNAPAAVKAYMGVASALEESSLSPVEQQVVLLAASVENRCHYCVAAHSVVAGMVGADEGVVDALRADASLPEARLEALRSFTTSVVRNRGWVPEDEVAAFLAAGFTQAQTLEVLVGVTLKTLSNYMNHLATTPVDGAFEAATWVHPAEQVAVAG